jgi:hypothetical protein
MRNTVVFFSGGWLHRRPNVRKPKLDIGMLFAGGAITPCAPNNWLKRLLRMV